MTQEEKQLLLQDLCARFPYGVKVLADIDKIFDGGCIGTLNMIQPYMGTKYPELKGQYLLYEKGSFTPSTVEEVRPYLRPMSSMTRAEVLEYISLKESIVASDGITYFFETYKSIDWLNKKMFDYRKDDEDKTMIEKGLAIKAPEGMY